MRIMLKCLSCREVKERIYEAVLEQYPNKDADVTVSLNSPIVPGTMYELRIAGNFPEWGLTDCSSDVLSFTSRETLRATSYTEYQRKLLNERSKNG